ncbi:MAG: hypothetical protein PHY59_05210 [Methanobacterium sp.]|nr:hypothetical protein [Methanobacterium sp.]
MDENKKKKTEEEMDEVSWATAEEEMKEVAPPDLLEKEDPELLKIYGNIKVNPPGSGGVKLKSKNK